LRSASSSRSPEELPDGWLYTTSSDLELTIDEADTQVIGLRFTGVAVPADAIVTAAWIEFTTDETDSNPTTLEIAAVAETDAGPFSGSFGVSVRPTTDATVEWLPDPWATLGAVHATPNLATLVSEVIRLDGWQTGNAMAFTITGNGERVAESWDGSPAQAPLLHIEYVTGSNAPPNVTAGASEPTDTTATLTATVTDDGMPEPANLTYSWAQTGGPASDIADTTALVTDVTLTVPGTYEFTMTASDGELTTSASTTVSLGAGPGDDPLLPDLISVAPDPSRQKYTVGDASFPDLDGRLLLRFDGYVTNVGDGPLHVTGNPQHQDQGDLNSHDVWQWVEQTDGSMVQARKVPILFETDDDHNHFHFMELIEYSLLVEETGAEAIPGAKVGFCLEDTEPVPGFASPGPQTYVYDLTLFCGEDAPNATSLVMGVTDGWQDVYGWDTNFQWFDVSELAPGEYRIQVIADPNDLVLESNETNSPALAPETSVVPGFAPTDVSTSATAGSPVSIELESLRFESTAAGAPAVGTPNYSVVTGPSNGTLDVVVGPLSGSTVVYTPSPGFDGVDSFSFGVRNSASPFPLVTRTATVTIDVDPSTGNVAPTVTAAAAPTAGGWELTATALDDGLPDPPGIVSGTWAQTGGPGADIADPDALVTAVDATEPGTYSFRITVSDGELTADTTVDFTIDDQSLTTSQFTIATGADDVEELGDGSLYSTSSDIELAVDSGPQTIGLRFTGVTIPRGAEIVSAWLQFTTDETDSAPAALTITGEASGDSAAFVGDGAVTVRTTVPQAVEWAPEPWPTVGEAGDAQRTPDLADIVGEITRRIDWDSGHALAFVITGSGTRTAESFNGAPEKAAVLHVEWREPPGDLNYAPTITVTGTDGEAPGNATLSVAAVDDGAPDPPGALTYFWQHISGPTAFINDPIASTTEVALSEPGDYEFAVTVSDGLLETTDVVTITGVPVGTTRFTATVPIASGPDDVEQLPNGYLYVGSSDLELTQEPSLTQVVGLRFTDVPLPAGSIVTSATIRFTVDEPGSGATDLTIRAVDDPNAAQFTGFGGVTARTLTTEAVQWRPEPWTTVGASGPAHTTPDLVELIAPLIEGPGWANNNALAFVITGTGTRTADSYEGNPISPAVLEIEYVIGSPPPNTSPTVTATATDTSLGGIAVLTATIEDDGLPAPGALTVEWEQTAGPELAAIDRPGSAVAGVSFTAEGEYGFQVTVSDGEFEVTETTTVTVSNPQTDSVGFAIIGDYGDGGPKQAAVARMIIDWSPDFVATVGDNVYSDSGYDWLVAQFYWPLIGGYNGQWGTGPTVNSFYPALGDHDYSDASLDEYLTFFDLPGPGTDSLGTSGNERYYDVRRGPVHLFVVNSNPEEPDGITATSVQAQWLEESLAASDAPWQVVTLHHPPYASGTGGTPTLRWPFEEWGADLVVAGDEHFYERLVIAALQYAISGLGVNNYDVDGAPEPESQVIYTTDDAGALFIVACDNAMQAEYRAIEGGIVDTFTIGTGTCP
jgi:hypothetical protein